MANTKKETNETKVDTQNPTDSAVAEEKQASPDTTVTKPEKSEKTAAKKAETKVELTRDTPVSLRSAIPNVHFTPKRSYPEYVWKEAGFSQEVPFSDFIEMKNQFSRFLDEPWLIIETEAVLDKFPNYRDLYNEFSAIESLSWLTGSADAVKKNLDSIPDTMNKVLLDRATSMISAGKIENIKVIKMLEEKLGTKLLNLIV